MKSIARILTTALFGVVFAGAPMLAQTVTINYDHSVNFLKFKTYTWAGVHATDPNVESRLTIALNRDMASRYMTQGGKNSDVTVTAVQATGNTKEYTDFYAGLDNLVWQQVAGGSGFLSTLATLQDVPLNTLIIDMYNTKTHALIWRGAVTNSAPVTGSEDKKANAIDKEVGMLIGKYPPKYVK